MSIRGQKISVLHFHAQNRFIPSAAVFCIPTSILRNALPVRTRCVALSLVRLAVFGSFAMARAQQGRVAPATGLCVQVVYTNTTLAQKAPEKRNKNIHTYEVHEQH